MVDNTESLITESVAMPMQSLNAGSQIPAQNDDGAVAAGTCSAADLPPVFIAHQRSSAPKYQSLETHLLEVSDLAQFFAQKIGMGSAGALIGLLHDLGKYSLAFQNYIQSAVGILNPDEDAEYVDAKGLKGKIDHSSAGAQLVWQELSRQGSVGHFAAQIFALCIASHHSGLIDCLGMSAGQEATDTFSKRMQKADALTYLAEARAKMDATVQARLRQLLAMPELLTGIKRHAAAIEKRDNDQQIRQFKFGLMTRFLFACLIDGDRINSADFEKPKAARYRRHGQYEAWPVLIERLEHQLASFSGTLAIDQIRASIALQCQQKADGAPGVYTLSVPTGGGKTLASLRFALHHAAKHGMDRVIYAIPFTSIIDQNARVVRAILEPDGVEAGSVVLEEHSNLMPDVQTWKTKLLGQNWDAPVIYTTNVQILETLFGGGTRSVRRMHQLANSVIVFDEIQTLPIKCIHLFCNAINYLVEQCGTTVVLCTATQPLIDRVEASKGALRTSPENEIIANVASLFKELGRVNVQNMIKPDGWKNTELVDLALAQAKTAGSCLVIVNTKKMAQALFAECRKQSAYPVYHLSTNMCPRHRKAILTKILAQLKAEGAEKLPLLCISTQLIEAGVDCDFGSVIRSLAGLDSIAQAAGRCNRHGLRATGDVLVVNPNEENADMLEDIANGKKQARRLFDDFAENPASFDDDLIGPKAIARYFEYYYEARAHDMAYHLSTKSDNALVKQQAAALGRDETLLDLLSTNPKVAKDYKRINQKDPVNYLRQSFMAAAKAFSVIDALTRGVIVPYGAEGEDLINELKSAYLLEKQHDLLRRAQQFTVNVFPNDMRVLLENRAVRPVQADIDILYLDSLYYDDDFGLGLTAKPMGVYFAS